jgi:hypothetical protein
MNDASGAAKKNADGSAVYVPGKTPVEMAHSAATELVALWRPNQGVVGAIKAINLDCL